MAIHKATLAKEIDSTIEYIYPKTTSDIVEYTSGVSVYDKLSEIAEVIDNLDTNLDTINENISTLTTNVSDNATNITTLGSTVEGHTSSISTLEDENAEVHYYFNPQNANRCNSGATSTLHGECNIIKAYGKVIMIDTGYTNRSEDIEAYLTEIGVTKIDYLIISHWHGDHCGNFCEGTMDYLDWSDCVCYFPVDVPSWMLDYGGAAIYKTKAITQAETNCAQIIYPEDYDELVINDYFKITFYNCGSTYLDEIKALQDDIEEFAGHDSSYSSQYYMNDSSMVCLVNHMGVKVLYSGDIMKAAQQRIYKAGFVNDVDVYKMHHHAVNLATGKQPITNYLYCAMINPKDVVIESNLTPAQYMTATTRDIGYFGKSNVYHSYDSYIEYVSSGGSITHITEDKKIVPLYPQEYQYYIFVDWTQTSNSDEADGSWWNPFRSVAYATQWVDSAFLNDTFHNLRVVIVVMEGDSADGGTTAAITSIRIPGDTLVQSYDYYDGSVNFDAGSNGEITDTAIESAKKFVLRGYAFVHRNRSLTIQGIRIAPNDDSFAATNISSYWLQSEHGANLTTNILVRYNGYLQLDNCVLDYDDVSPDIVNDDAVHCVYLASSARCYINRCYISNCKSAVYCGDNNMVKIYGLRTSKIIKIINGRQTCNADLYIVFGAWLLDLNLGYPDYVSASAGSVNAISIYCDVHMSLDISSERNIAYNDEAYTSYDIFKMIKYPISYRSINPIITNGGSLINTDDALYQFQSGPATSVQWYDAYGARTDLAQLGAYTLIGGMSIERLVEISEDYYDWDNILFPGCWPVIGTSYLNSFTNTPSGTTMNGKLICESLGGSTTTYPGYYRQTYIDRVGRKFERTYDASSKWSTWIMTTGNMFSDYTDEGEYLYETLAITTQPADVVVDAEGDDATMTIVATGYGLRYHWYYKNPANTEFQDQQHYKSTITIAVTSNRDGRQMYCIVSDSFGNSVTSDIATMSIASS